MNGQTKKQMLEKLDALRKYIKFLESYKTYSPEEIEDNYTVQSAVERNMHLALECVIDIGEMLISLEKLEKPASNREIILLLGKNKILPPDFARKFAPAMGLRNILVHQYDKIDHERLQRHMKDEIEDFDIFARHIIKYLKKSK
ncbi:MAG: DUF86 domain-containing protein [Candidatus Aenigmarchaeota archaeon]|nr:DUF86 domain-containing protein [Candidatus Aenigmarchaeota archaeon]